MGNIIYVDGTDKEIFPTDLIEGFDNTTINEIVGGYYELVPTILTNGAMLAVNEDGVRLGLPFNRNASIVAGGVPIVGNAILILNKELN